MTLRTGFATALQWVRKTKGFSQEDFSDVSSRTYLSSLERGIKSPTLDKIEDLASVLEIHPTTLIVLASMKAENKEFEQMIEQIRKEFTGLKQYTLSQKS